MRAIDYRALAALDAVIGHGSFEKAAAALAISQPAVSQRIRTLENAAGTLLVVRSQPPQATAAGQRLIAHFRQVRLLEAALEAPAGPSAQLPALAIAVNADSAATWILEALEPLLTPPSCTLDIRLDDQDHTLSQLREGRVFACVTSETVQVAGTTSTPLGVMHYICAAAPAFAERWFGGGFTADAVRRAPALVFDQRDALLDRYVLQQLGAPQRYPRHSLASSEAFVRFIEAGVAYGMVPLLQVGAELAAGTLVEVVPGAGLDVPLIWHAWDIQTPLTRRLSAQIIATARKRLRQAP
ncbi:LysR family transcriptional regulator ArgP [Janthinobacterium fluminis]|uniref:LysR family transcriptional regulator ArgP n=1 Tax=Janthinobacterium fluminis TaxID=2987524 RepID=A0ABT5JVY7_9BURK|nr:LysR family transcriptional regulator ArgP [Janthinobacterium fluminis]MDC8756328.1 LysR family transcriptional regulator ArgP [Janthinobacterium fluminis]